jgi:hypothetical protein
MTWTDQFGSTDMLTLIIHLEHPENIIERRAGGMTGSQLSTSTRGDLWNVGTMVFGSILWGLSPIVHPMIKNWWDRRGGTDLERMSRGNNEARLGTPLGSLQSSDDPVQMSRGQSRQGDAIVETTHPSAHPSSGLDATTPDSVDSRQPDVGE